VCDGHAPPNETRIYVVRIWVYAASARDLLHNNIRVPYCVLAIFSPFKSGFRCSSNIIQGMCNGFFFFFYSSLFSTPAFSNPRRLITPRDKRARPLTPRAVNHFTDKQVQFPKHRVYVYIQPCCDFPGGGGGNALKARPSHVPPMYVFIYVYASVYVYIESVSRIYNYTHTYMQYSEEGV
jgi:hypothetical protein